jgi:2-polyprenyl-3-methyl-5-hydroxy-6-metoxy-1,4-benzoquinol methylase
MDLKFQMMFCPVKLKPARKIFGSQHIRILDVGCGNHSPTITKHWLKNSEYHGADIQYCNLDDRDLANMDKFHQLTPVGGGFEHIPNGFYDYIIMHHVIEHIHDQGAALKTVCEKLKPGGVIWVAFPSVRSLALPSADGTLNFCDDPTHVRVCDVKDVANWLLDNNVKILKGGRSNDVLLYLLGLAILPLAYARKLLTGRLKSSGLWHVLGFEDRVIGQKRDVAVR